MVKLSQYSCQYEDGKFQLMPWEFWTDEQRSQVIYQAYKEHHLTSKQVKGYLDTARRHMVTQFIVPIAAGALYFGVLRHSLVKTVYRRSPQLGLVGGVGFVALSTILWVNLSPFYTSKLASQQKTLDVLYHKLGPSMRLLNDLIPRTRTSSDIDIRTRMIYSQRNGFLAGTIFAEDDHAPPILQRNPVHKYNAKRHYL